MGREKGKKGTQITQYCQCWSHDEAMGQGKGQHSGMKLAELALGFVVTMLVKTPMSHIRRTGYDARLQLLT